MAALQKRQPTPIDEVSKKDVALMLLRAGLALHTPDPAKLKASLPASKPSEIRPVTQPRAAATGKPPFRQGKNGVIIADSVERLHRHRFLRDEILPALEIALEDDLTEAGRLKKFGAVLRAVSVLASPPGMVTAQPSLPPQVAVQGESPASKALTKILTPATGQGGSPPKKKPATGPQTPAGRSSR